MNGLQNQSGKHCGKKKISAYMNRYAYEPTIAVWELWNEINTVEASWDIIKTWTQNAIKTLKSLAPKQLVVNSLGSYDCDDAKIAYKDFDSVEMDFMQVHRYLDQGCGMRYATILRLHSV